MKLLLQTSLAALVLLAAACKGGESGTSTTTAAATTTTAATTTPATNNASVALIPKKLSYAEAKLQLKGMWLNKKYLREVADLRSVRAAELKYKILGFSLLTEELEKGSDVKLYGFGTHEGGMDAPLKWDEAAGEFAHDLAKYAADDYKFFEAPFRLYIIESGEMVIEQPNKTPEIFVKENGDDISLAIQRQFFEGTYKDDKGTTFTLKDGKVTGRADADEYGVSTDFYPYEDFDMVTLGKKDSPKTKSYHYKFTSPNNVDIYAVKGDDENGYTIGEKVGNWTRQ